MKLSRYTVKRALLTPYTTYKRRRTRDLDPVARAILEAQYFRPSIYRFMQAMGAHPDLLVEADVDASSIVVDAGAFVGEWSEQISQRYGSQIYAFEPNPFAARKLDDRIGAHPNVRTFHYGLGRRDEAVMLTIDGPGSTAYASNGTFGSAEVEVRDIVGVLADLDIDHIDLCKVNIEGGEYDLFDRMIAAGWFPRTRIVSVQFHEWLPHAYARRRAIRRELARTHEEVWNYPFVWELWRRRDGSRPVQERNSAL